MTRACFDNDGAYWRRMSGIDSPPPVIIPELYEKSIEDPYWNTIIVSPTINHYHYENEKLHDDTYTTYFRYLPNIPQNIFEYLSYKSLLKKTIEVLKSYIILKKTKQYCKWKLENVIYVTTKRMTL